MRKCLKKKLWSLGTYLGSGGGLTFERFIVIGGKCDRLIPMGTRVTPKPMVSLGKVWLFNLFDLHVRGQQLGDMACR